MKTTLLLILLNFLIFSFHISSLEMGVSAYATIFIGIAFSFLIEFYVRYAAYKKLDPDYIGKKLTEKPKLRWLLLSPGYYFSNLFKEKIKETFKKKHIKADLVTHINNLNLITSVSIFSIATLTSLTVTHANLHTLIVNLLIGLASFRTISRCCEIIYAFVKDILDENIYTSTSLNKFSRVRLAINSYVENIFNFATLYYSFTPESSTISNLFDSIGRSTISNVQPECSDNLINIAVYGQVITSLVLVVLSLAVYVGRKK